MVAATASVTQDNDRTDRAARDGLVVRHVGISFGGIRALNDFSFEVHEGEICGLIGPNGAGKTTLFNCVSRLYQADEGSITYRGHDLLATPAHGIARVGIARTFQNLALVPALSVIDNVLVGLHSRTSAGFARSALRLPGVGKEARIARGKALQALELLGLRDLAYHPAAGLPFGTLKRVELARAIASEPSMLLLDEPASGLTHGEVDELAAVVRALRDELALTVLLVEHHMGMVFGLCERVVVLALGEKLAEGTPSEIAADPAVVEAYLGRPAGKGDRAPDPTPAADSNTTNEAS